MIQKRNAFTLMEIMVVVLLIGIIAAFAIPSYSKSIQKSHERDMAMQLRAIYMGNIHYRVMVGNFWISGAPTTDLAVINSTLGINVVSSDGTIYEYRDGATPGDDFTIWSTWNNGVADVSFEMTENPNGTIGCITGNCLLTF